MTKQEQIKQWAARRERMRVLRDKGWTLDRIANTYVVSKQRVLQIVGKRTKANGEDKT